MKVSTKIQMTLLATVAVLFSGGCWGGHYQWALTGLVDHGLKSVDESNFENGTGMLMVKTSDDYWVGESEVTQSQFEKIMGYNPIEATISQSRSKQIAIYQQPDIPVFYVSSLEAMSFCNELTNAERAVALLPQGYVYTLPTDKQWRAFVADSKEADAVFSKKNKGISGPKKVASLRPNRLGLYDVRGNVREYCFYHEDGPKGKVIQKGGDYKSSITWEERQIDCGWGLRPFDNTYRNMNVGFRVVLVKEPASQ